MPERRFRTGQYGSKFGSATPTYYPTYTKQREGQRTLGIVDPADRKFVDPGSYVRGSSSMTTRRSDDHLAQRGGGIFGGFGGGYRRPDLSGLNSIRNQEIAAMRRLLDLQFQQQRTILEGDVAQTELDRDYKIARLDRALRQETEGIKYNFGSRGLLDSGFFVEDVAEAETAVAEEKANEVARAGALIGGLRSQLGLLDAMKAAQIASQRASIERAYFMARLQAGG